MTASAVPADSTGVDEIGVDVIGVDVIEVDVNDANDVDVTDLGRRVKLAQVVDEALDVEAHRALVASARAGAEVVFCGVVRDHDHGRDVQALEYVAHPDADTVLRRVASAIAAQPGVLALAVSHRIGALAVGDIALVAAVSCAHRGAAFEACARLVDQVKQELPIWKRQMFADGSDEWVNSP